MLLKCKHSKHKRATNTAMKWLLQLCDSTRSRKLKRTAGNSWKTPENAGKLLSPKKKTESSCPLHECNGKQRSLVYAR